MGIPKVTVDTMLIKLTKGPIYCHMDKRPVKYMFGANNYGEVFGFINPADGDRWDVLVPGYPRLSFKKRFKIKKVEGIILYKNGNHKIVVDVETPLQRNPNFWPEVKAYRNNYEKIVKLRGQVVPFQKENNRKKCK
tara:strand:+ start:127 stop:534 length:408 start_codon:yes stop_codon:yes gene_type:complete